MMLAIVAAAYAAALFFDFRPRLKDSAKGEKVLYLLLMAISLAPLLLDALAIPVPSPAKPIEQAVKALFHVS
jgi:hypothetical protein